MKKVDQKEFEQLEKAGRTFIRNLVTLSGKKPHEANRLFIKNADLITKTKMLGTSLLSACLNNNAYTLRAKLLVVNSELAVPVLTKIHGERQLVQAFCETAVREDTMKLTKELGGVKIAALMKKSM